MSRAVAALVYSRQVGSMARKAVLAYFAERANDDGTGIWSSKQRIADEIECSKQTVITTIQGLIADGLVQEAGLRKCSNGHTIEYDVVLAAVSALPEAKRSDQPVKTKTGPDLDRSDNLTSRGQTVGPKPSSNRPSSTKTSSSPKRRARSKPERISADWNPGPLPESVAKLVAGWPPGRLEIVTDEFRDFWLSAEHNAAKTDWDRTFLNRLRDRHLHFERTDNDRRNSSTGRAPRRSAGGSVIDACLAADHLVSFEG